jgi:hypothetical protein
MTTPIEFKAWLDSPLTKALKQNHKEAVKAEREACAKVCKSEWSNLAEKMYGHSCATIILARSNT